MAAELALWKPVRELGRIRNDMDYLWDSFFEDLPAVRNEWAGQWLPSLDVAETKNEFVVKAEIPGMDPKHIDISLSDNVLTIKGEKRHEQEEKDEGYHVVERSYGSFVRSIQLPGRVKGDKVKASYKDGVLRVALPKSEEVRRKEVKIKLA